MPRELPKFVLSSISTATSYRFLVDGRLGGWAICTVNDATGELSIQSDWGTWAYRWNTDHLGGSKTLTQFLADISGADYLTCKLMPREDSRKFSSSKTVIAMRQAMTEGDGHARRLWTDEDFRECWDAIQEIVDEHAHEDFPEPIAQAMWHDDRMRPWFDRFETTAQWFEFEESYSLIVLRDAILPALIAVLTERAAPAPPAPDLKMDPQIDVQ